MVDLEKKEKKELIDLLEELKAERTKLQFAVHAAEERNVRKLRSLKKDIARVLTCLKQFENKAEEVKTEEGKTKEK